MMQPEDKAYLRSLPLLLSSALLAAAGAFAFFRANDQIASVAAFAAALILVGVWIGTVVVDHDHSTHHRRDTPNPPPEDP